MTPRLRATGLAALAVVAALSLSYLPLVTNQGLLITDDNFTSDIVNAEWAGRIEMGRLVREGVLPVWTRNIFTGASFLAPGPGSDPLTLVLFATLPPVTAVNVYIVCVLLIAGLGTVALARELGASTSGAAIAGIGFILSGYLVCQLKHLTIICCIAFTPWALRALLKAFSPQANRVYWLSVFAALYGFQWLAGFAQSAYIATLVYIGWGFTQIITNSKRSRWLADTVAFGLAGISGVAIGTLQLFEALALTKLSSRSEGVSIEWATRFNYWLPNLWSFVQPYKHGDIGDHTYVGPSIFWEDYSYTGIVTLTLAVGAALAFRARGVRLMWVTAIVAMLFVLGSNTPFFGLAFRVLPGLSFFRFPTRFLFVVHLALCLLAGIGLTHFEAWVGRRWSQGQTALPKALGWLVVGLSFVDLQYFQLRQNPIADAARWLQPPESSVFLKENLGDFRSYSYLATKSHLRAAQAAHGWADLEPLYQTRDLIEPDTNLLWGLAAADGYIGLSTKDTSFLWGSSQVPSRIGSLVDASLTDPKRLDELVRVLRSSSVKYLLSPLPLPSLGPAITLGSVFGYELKNPAARFHFANRTASFATNDDAFKAMRLSSFEPEHDLLWVGEGQPPSEVSDDAGARVTLTHETALVSELEVFAPNEAWLVNAETFHPKWVASIDGATAPVLRANINQRAIRVPAGQHHIRFAYDDSSSKAAAWVSLLSLLAALAIAGITRRRATAPVDGGGSR